MKKQPRCLWKRSEHLSRTVPRLSRHGVHYRVSIALLAAACMHAGTNAEKQGNADDGLQKVAVCRGG